MTDLIPYIKAYLNDNRRWLKIVWSWFVVSAVAGAVAFFIKPDLLITILEMFEERFGEDPSLNFGLAREIFSQNLRAAGIALFGGVVLGIAPIAVVAVNGFLLGFIIVSLIIVNEGGIISSLGFIIGGIVPHGILELPAFLLAAAIGVRLGIEWLTQSAQGQRWSILGKNFIEGVKIFVLIAIVLFLAAMIEVFITGKIVEKF